MAKKILSETQIKSTLSSVSVQLDDLGQVVKFLLALNSASFYEKVAWSEPKASVVLSSSKHFRGTPFL